MSLFHCAPESLLVCSLITFIYSPINVILYTTECSKLKDSFIVTDDPCSKPDQKCVWQRDRQNYIQKNKVNSGLRTKEFHFVYNIHIYW
jgi:hypothetical protein